MNEELVKQLKLDPEVKDELLRLAENVTEDIAQSVFRIAEILIKNSGNKFDDLLLPALPFIEDKVMKVIEEIHKD